MSSRDRSDFVGRSDVLKALAGHLEWVDEKQTGRIVAIRGRRQVGKSTLVEMFVDQADAPYVFVTGVYQASLAKQLADATNAFTESTRPLPDIAHLTQSALESWHAWFETLALAARSGPVVAVLDEFGWLAAGDPTLEHELSSLWAKTLATLPVLLLLIGAEMTVPDQLPAEQVEVPALNPAEVAEALPGRSAVDVFDAHLVTGGYPRLVHELAISGANVTEFVRTSLTDHLSPLVTTGRLCLHAEFPEPQFAYQVLSAIGSSDDASTRFNELLGDSADEAHRKRAETATTRALRTLTDTKGLIERELPAWAAASSKLRRYRVIDSYLRFWFRYVEHNVDRIARGRSDLAIAAFDRDWETWRAQSIQPLVRAALLRLAGSDPHLTGAESVVAWWVRDKTIEIDAVAASPERTVLMAAIKWASGDAAVEISRLREHLSRVPHSESAVVAAISADGSTATGADVSYSAADLLLAWD